ncbi:MAG TPA: SEC-C domain-containing protein, partial [Acetobacteraceae bacterium]|nr:SEC-C domain-containing protein [Acetobacteraceae bacterium]
MLAGAQAEPMMEMAGAGTVATMTLGSAAVDPNDPATWANSPRNAPCPCGSGRKFKHCHGRTI